MATAASKTATTEYASGDFPNLNSALSAFQSTIPVPTKDSSADAGKYTYGYASLDALVPVIFPRLSAVGLAYVAVPDVNEQGVFGLRAKLVHTSGEEVGGFYPLGSPNAPAQAIGSAISYARRYALLSLTGVAPTGEDDDGASAQKSPPAAANTDRKEAPGSTGAQAKVTALLNDPTSLVTGDDANAVMGEIAPGKTPGEWTAKHLTECLARLEALNTERKASK